MWRVASGGQRVVIGLGAAVFAAFPACAQMYLFDPARDNDANTNVYFGSTRDSGGRFLEGVTASLRAGNVTYVMTTDADGRFKIHVPKEVPLDSLQFSCTKRGYVLKRVRVRKPQGGATSPVQADCVLVPGVPPAVSQP